jgi:hypothetical protein
MPFIGIGVGIGRQRFAGGGVAPYVGLLDDYPDAAAAYSLRLLKSDYTGDAIRVRRSSDNAEQNIGFDGSGNLDTSALTAFCSGTDGFVTTWYDQSGNNRNQVQSSATKQPQIFSVATGIILNPDNSKPSILLDGSNDGFSTTFSIPISTSLNLFSVLKTSDTAGIQYSDNSDNDRWVFILQSGSTDVSISDRFGITSIYKNNTLQSLLNRNSWYLAFGNNVTHLSLLQGSIVVEGWAKLSLFDYPTFNLGGYSQEIIIYSGALSLEYRNGVSNNINTTYGIY